MSTVTESTKPTISSIMPYVTEFTEKCEKKILIKSDNITIEVTDRNTSSELILDKSSKKTTQKTYEEG